MRQLLIIFFFTLLTTLFYNYVGHMVPQKEVHPPKVVEVKSEMTSEEMVEAGKLIVAGKGTCLNCHNGSARFPVLEGVGERAKTRKDGTSDVDYLAEALYEPNTFIVEPFAPGMPAVNKPPIGLNDKEILTVMAYLQSLGGTPSVTMTTKLKYQSSSEGGASAPASAPPAQAAPAQDLTGDKLLAQYGCTACHSMDNPQRLVGPSLYDIGKRLNKAQIYEAIMEPDAVVAPDYPPGVMTATLVGTGFYEKASSKQLKTLVEYLSALKGTP